MFSYIFTIVLSTFGRFHETTRISYTMRFVSFQSRKKMGGSEKGCSVCSSWHDFRLCQVQHIYTAPWLIHCITFLHFKWIDRKQILKWAHFGIGHIQHIYNLESDGGHESHGIVYVDMSTVTVNKIHQKMEICCRCDGIVSRVCHIFNSIRSCFRFISSGPNEMKEMLALNLTGNL